MLVRFYFIFDQKLGTLFLNRYMLQFTWMCTGKVTILPYNYNYISTQQFCTGSNFRTYYIHTHQGLTFLLVHPLSINPPSPTCTAISSLLQLLFLQIRYAVALGAEQLLDARLEVFFIDRHARGGGTELCAREEGEVECIITMVEICEVFLCGGTTNVQKTRTGETESNNLYQKLAYLPPEVLLGRWSREAVRLLRLLRMMSLRRAKGLFSPASAIDRCVGELL